MVSLTYRVHQTPNWTDPGRSVFPPINPQEVANPIHVKIHEDTPHAPHNFLIQHPPIGANNEEPIPSVPVTLLSPLACTKPSISASSPAFPVPHICVSDVTFEFSLMLPTVIRFAGFGGSDDDIAVFRTQREDRRNQ